MPPRVSLIFSLALEPASLFNTSPATGGLRLYRRVLMSPRGFYVALITIAMNATRGYTIVYRLLEKSFSPCRTFRARIAFKKLPLLRFANDDIRDIRDIRTRYMHVGQN